MKRFLTLAVLSLLMLASLIGTAEAKQRKKKAADPKVVEATAESSKTERGPDVKPEMKRSTGSLEEVEIVAKPGPIAFGKPIELQLHRAASRRFDLRSLPQTRPVQQERAELEPPFHVPVMIEHSIGNVAPESTHPPFFPIPTAPAPPPIAVYEGLDRFNWGAGSPPDTNGDVGPNNYIQTVNTSVGVFRKSDGFQQAAFTFNTFMSQGNFGNLCDTNNFGDPVVLYDTFEDRWIITDFAFLTDMSGNVLAPAYQCFAASMTGDPVAGGWNFYSIQISDALNDYEKFGIWPDGLYMSANMFTFGAGSAFVTARAWAFNKAQMYAGSPTVKVVTFNIPGGDFAVMPSNARLQTGTPPAGRPNLFMSSWQFTNALTVYKFHVDWNSVSLSTFTGPDTPIAATSWPNAAVGNAGQPGTATLLDVLQIRAMVQNQYTNFGGTESLWLPHTVRRPGNCTSVCAPTMPNGTAAPRWYQVNVTGGTVAGAIPQAATWDPDAANITNRFMPSLALDRAGNMAMGYSVSSAVNEPLGTSPATNCATCVNTFASIMYAGRLASDPVNTFSQTEQTFFTGTASQTGTTRWGDYSGMALDPDGCTFWYTNEYANPADQTFNHRWLTKFGSFGPFPGCVPVGAGGTVSGAVTVNPGGAPISSASVQLGARTTTTDGSGNYSFTGIPAGTYPSMTASKPGFGSSSASSIVVTDGGTTTQNFSLAAAPPSACLTDTTQADFQTGVASATVDINASPGDVALSNAPAIDQQNTAGTSTGTGFGTPNWTGQTFIAAVTGQLVKADIQLFCNGCGATPPNLTLSVRATAAGLPTGADLASVTVPGSAFASGNTTLFTATFGSPATLTSGTHYALILRPVAVPAGSGYFWIRSSPSTYANGSRVLSADSGGTWSSDTTRDYNFKTYMQTGYAASGNFTSSPKDANPGGGITPIWSTFSWNAATPALTSLQFQLAGSNNPNGPFSFVGPDGTAGTFFTTSPVQLSPQFYNLRYMSYKAFLATTNSAVTPALNDATFCFNDVDCSSTTATITPTPASVCASSTGNSASGPAGMTSYAWGIANGTITSATNTQSITYTAGASGNVTLSLTVTAPNGCIVSSSTPITINPIPQQPVITPGGPTTFCAGGSVTLSSDSASGNQWYESGNPIAGETNQTYNATTSGNYTVVVTSLNCSSPASSTTAVTVNPLPPTPSITPGGPTTFCTGGSVTLTSDSATGNQWNLNGNPIGGATNTTYIATASGSYTVRVTDGNNCSATSSATVVTVDTMPTTPTISGTTNGTGTQDQACPEQPLTLTATSTGATSYQWYQDNNTLNGETSSTTIVTGVGTYYVTATNGTCTTPQSAGYVVQNPTPHSAFLMALGPTTFCAGGSVTLQSNSATGIQWYLDGNPLPNPNNQNRTVSVGGTYTVILDALGCHSQVSNSIVVTVNPLPATPTITPGGPTTFCAGGSVTLTSSAASGNQWYLNGNPIGGATNTTYPATASGSYTVKTTDGNSCTSAASNAIAVTVNPTPATPTITPGGPTTFCTGGSVVLTSSSASGNQWYANGNPIGGQTNQTLNVSVAGDYSVVVTSLGCSSAPSATTTVTINPNPNAAITTAASTVSGSTGNSASVANAGAGATYNWSITNGTITAGSGTNAITFTAGAVGTLTLQATVTTSANCSDTKSANVNVTPLPPAVQITSIVPSNGSYKGGQPVTINGLGFLSGATVTFGGTAATNVVVVSATKITAKTPAHAAGVVDVTVTNTNTTSATATNGYTYHPQQFDANGDNVTDPSDIFYLVNYLFTHGPAPRGTAGMLSGDANGDGIVDPSDIFFVIMYLFNHGEQPYGHVVSTSAGYPLAGTIALGNPVVRDGRTFIPVIISRMSNSETPQSLSIRLRFESAVSDETIVRRTGAAKDVAPMFEINRRNGNELSYLLAFDQSNGGLQLGESAVVVAEIEIDSLHAGKVSIDPTVTMLCNATGTRSATVANGMLHIVGAADHTPRLNHDGSRNH
jgi:hypothetical protein